MIPIFGRAGPQAVSKAYYRTVSANGAGGMLPSGRLIDTAKTRDVSNPLQPLLLNAGLLMGKITSSGNWANSIIGVNQAAYTSGDTSITVTAAQAAEIVRRVGATGSLLWAGPPSAAGTVAVTGPINYSAINTTTGVITTSTLGVNKIAGTFALQNDGSGIPRSFIGDGYGLTMGTDSSNLPTLAEWPWVPYEYLIDGANLIDWPSDTSLQAWIMSSLVNGGYGGKFTFTNVF